MADFLWPTHSITVGIVAFLFALFIVWLAILASVHRRIRRYEATLNQLRDVSFLTQHVFPGPEEGSDEEEIDSIFESFVSERDLPAGSPLVEHVEDILGRVAKTPGWKLLSLSIIRLKSSCVAISSLSPF